MVIFMKIILFSKRELLIKSFLIIIIVLFIMSVLLYFQNSKALTIEASSDSECDEFVGKIQNLTKGTEKIAYLTFDDGPTEAATPKILDILKEEDVKASFFVIGKYVSAHPEIVKRAYEEGHYIANHGYDHNNSNMYKSMASFREEVEKTDAEIGKTIGVEGYSAKVFRFPNGYMSSVYKGKKKEAAKILSEMGYAYIDWNCLNNDSVKKYTSAQLLNNLKKSAKNKDTLVILMHDTKDVSDSSEVLKDSIEYLKSQGYEFRNFYDLM